MITPQDKPEVPSILIERLGAAGITEAVIIDDLFDGPSTRDIEKTIEHFRASLAKDSSLSEELDELCGDFDTASELDEEHLDKLWRSRDQLSAPLRELTNELLQFHDEQIRKLETVAEFLSSIGIRVHTRGPYEEVPENVQLVFLDYLLESTDIPTEAELFTDIAVGGKEKRSETIARNLAERQECAPFLILFSSYDKLAQIQARFRARTNYLGGTFACIAKHSARTRDKLAFELGSCGVGHPALGVVRDFFRAVLSSLDNASEEFRRTVLALDVQDYSFIQRMSLAEDGEPLGEYMLELLAGVLSYQLREQTQIQKARERLDDVRFSKHLPSSTQPSMPLARFFRYALTEPCFGDVAPHPWAKYVVEPEQPEKTLIWRTPPPLLRLGDIFGGLVSEPVFMVINPACDLQYSPGERPPDRLQPVYLIPGKLEDPTLPIQDLGRKRTELFEYGSKSWRIVWDHEHVYSVPLGEIACWMDNRGYSRVGRLSLTYALSVQRVWTSHLSRVGLPVSLPLFEAVDCEIFIRSAQGVWERSGEVLRGGIILARQHGDSVVRRSFALTRVVVERIHEALADAAVASEGMAAAVPEGDHAAKKVKGLHDKAARARALIVDLRYWIDLLETPHILAKENQRFDKPPISFVWNNPPEAQGKDAAFLIINIVPPRILSEANSN